MSYIGRPRRSTFSVVAYNDQAAIRRLAEAVRETERDHPLPRCVHGKALRDAGGEALEPPCGCRANTVSTQEPSNG